jgi:hypothetical protein
MLFFFCPPISPIPLSLSCSIVRAHTIDGSEMIALSPTSDKLAKTLADMRLEFAAAAEIRAMSEATKAIEAAATSKRIRAATVLALAAKTEVGADHEVAVARARVLAQIVAARDDDAKIAHRPETLGSGGGDQGSGGGGDQGGGGGQGDQGGGGGQGGGGRGDQCSSVGEPKSETKREAESPPVILECDVEDIRVMRPTAPREPTKHDAVLG